VVTLQDRATSAETTESRVRKEKKRLHLCLWVSFSSLSTLFDRGLNFINTYRKKKIAKAVIDEVWSSAIENREDNYL